MMFPTFSMDYYPAVSQDCFFQNFNSEYMKLTVLNKELEEKNTLLMKKLDAMQHEN